MALLIGGAARVFASTPEGISLCFLGLLLAVGGKNRRVEIKKEGKL